MNRYSFLINILLMACLAGRGYLIQPDVKRGMTNLEKGSYELDQRHTTVLFKVNHMGLSQFVGRFNRVYASLEYDPENPASAKLTAVIETDSVDVNNPDFSETLTGSGWFDSANFPQATFVTTGVELIDGDRATFNGELILLGVTAPVALNIRFNGGADNILTGRYTLGFSATGTIKRSAFGMDQYIPAVGDDVELEIHAEFQRW